MSLKIQYAQNLYTDEKLWLPIIQKGSEYIVYTAEWMPTRRFPICKAHPLKKAKRAIREYIQKTKIRPRW